LEKVKWELGNHGFLSVLWKVCLGGYIGDFVTDIKPLAVSRWELHGDEFLFESETLANLFAIVTRNLLSLVFRMLKKRLTSYH